MVIRIEPLCHLHGFGFFGPARHGKIPFIFVGNVPELFRNCVYHDNGIEHMVVQTEIIATYQIDADVFLMKPVFFPEFKRGRVYIMDSAFLGPIIFKGFFKLSFFPDPGKAGNAGFNGHSHCPFTVGDLLLRAGNHPCRKRRPAIQN